MSAPKRPTADALAVLTRAHVLRVPFENLLIQLGRPAPLSPSTTAARIARGGGGYCFELNGAFGALLASLGYRVRRHPGRCWIGEPDPPRAPVNHLALTVGCADGAWWFVEVGMSDAVCEPLPLRPGRYVQGPFAYSLEALDGPAGPGWRFHHDPRGSFGGMDFTSTVADDAVFRASHRRLSTTADSPFVRRFSVGRRDLSGLEVLRGRVFCRWGFGDSVAVVHDDADAWFELLADHFGLPIDGLEPGERTTLWRRVSAAHIAWESQRQPP